MQANIRYGSRLIFYALVVEDKEDIRNLLVEQMEEKGCYVRKANDGAVVLVTALNTPDVTIKAVELGVKYRLAKPWEQSQLDFVFESALNLNKAR